jgi:hypothetical protein
MELINLRYTHPTPTTTTPPLEITLRGRETITYIPNDSSSEEEEEEPPYQKLSKLHYVPIQNRLAGRKTLVTRGTNDEDDTCVDIFGYKYFNINFKTINYN